MLTFLHCHAMSIHHPLSMSVWGLGLFFKVVIVQVVHTNNYGILDVLQIVVQKTQH